MENKDTGLLINKQDAELHRAYFEEMVLLMGVQVLYRAPLKGAKKRDSYGEMLDDLYNTPQMVGCIFDEHPTVWTTRKLGWNTERNETKPIIHVPYNLNVEDGGLFIIPSALDNTQGRVFKVTDMSTTMIYPSSIACQLAPYIKSNFNKADNNINYEKNNFTILKENEEDD